MIRIGLVGCGFMGRMHANVYSLLPNAELAGICDHRPDKRERFAADFDRPAFDSIEAMIADKEIDAVDICLPTYLHKDATIRAAQAGKHVMCEKPMALTVADADAMIDAVNAGGVKLMIGHCIRFWPEYAVLKSLVDSKELGELTSINLTRYGEFPSWSSENWLADEAKSGGGVLDMHIHDTDYVLYILGQPKSSHSWGTIDGRGPSHVYTTMVYDNCVAHLQGGWNLPPKTPFKMAFRAIFQRGAAIMDGGPLTIYRESGEPEAPQFERRAAEGGGNIADLGGYFVELKYFVDCLENGRPFEIVTPQSSRASLAATLEEIRQIRENQC